MPISLLLIFFLLEENRRARDSLPLTTDPTSTEEEEQMSHLICGVLTWDELQPSLTQGTVSEPFTAHVFTDGTTFNVEM